ncbi:MAG: hypothetical protein HFE76_05840 [Firmicutes bacterium]|jgi:allantoin racemase|nr:hypothetical protein [Bacillota bacterium]
MKIAIIDPVVGVRKEYLKQDAAYLKKHLRQDTEFEFERISAGFPSVETVTQDIINGAHIVEKVFEIQDKNYDGIFINCFDDPGVLAAREISRIPVMGPYVPAMHYAATISEKIGVISTDPYGIRCEERKAAEHGLTQLISSIKMVNMTVLDLEPDTLVERITASCAEFEEEGIYAAVLGCTGMNSIADGVREELKSKGSYIQLIEPMKVGMKMLELVIEMGDSNRIKSTAIDFRQYFS